MYKDFERCILESLIFDWAKDWSILCMCKLGIIPICIFFILFFYSLACDDCLPVSIERKLSQSIDH